jgi:hypothetical protein
LSLETFPAAKAKAGAAAWRSPELQAAAAMPADAVLAELDSTPDGLSSAEAARRLAAVGPNALRSHGVRALEVLARQVRNPLLLLLISAALVSAFVGEVTDAVIILAIVCLSVGLGFVNEYRSARAVEALHSRLRHTALARRDGRPVSVDVTELVPGDVVQLGVGDVVPADVRPLRIDGLECDESVLTGEAVPMAKQVEAIDSPESPLALAPCAFMGTVVQHGDGSGVVTRTGAGTEFGKIAMRLGDRQPETAFQRGLNDYSLMLVRVMFVMAGAILMISFALGRGFLESVLFSLAIAVGLTPQLLPAIVTVSLSTGARRALFVVPRHNRCSLQLYEVALMLDTWLRREGAREHFDIALTTDEASFAESAGPRMHDVIEREFTERHIDAHAAMRLLEVRAHEATFAGGRDERFDLLVAAPPHQPGVRYESLPADERGFVRVDGATRQVIGHPEIYAPGDAGDFPLKDSFLALLQAGAAARHLAAAVTRRRFDDAFEPTSMQILDMLDKAAFAQLPLEATGDPDHPVRLRAGAADEYKVGVARRWRAARRMLSSHVLMQFAAGEPVQAGPGWHFVDHGVRAMAGMLPD